MGEIERVNSGMNGVDLDTSCNVESSLFEAQT